MKKIFSYFENLLNAYPEKTAELSKDNLKEFIWLSLAGAKKWLFFMLLMTAFIGIFEALLFSWLGDIVDWLNTYGLENFLAEKKAALYIMLAVVLMSTLWVLLGSMLHFQTLQGNFPMRLRWQFHQRMLSQSMQFYQDELSGRVSAKVMQTAVAVRDTVVGFTSMFVFVLVYFSSISIILCTLDVLLVIPFIAWIVGFVLALRYFIPRLKVAAIEQADARSLMTGRITDAYANINTVKLFSHNKRELNYTKSAMKEFMVSVHKQMRHVTALEVTNHLLNLMLIISVVFLGLYLWQQEQISVGAFATAGAIALRINGLAHWIMWQSAMLFENLGTVQDGMNTFSKDVSIKDKTDAQTLEVKHANIDFKAVYFEYQKSLTDDAVDTQKILLNDFALSIKAGEKVGLVGRSGAGKSTLVNLLLRFYDIQSGQINIDNINIADVTQESLRAQIGMVTQDTALLHRSIRDNISYGRPEASEAEIIAACKQAHAWEFINDLQGSNGCQGLDTLVGERGVKLSGGQRQRIAIARVILKDAPILILDEATSALDSEIEQAITQSLQQLMTYKTVIAIAHRLSTIASLDRLIVLDKGKIVEQGTHQELIALNGLYASLWARQSGGFLGD